ncbi:hypothetical protein K0M31_006987 [Melipona bicolor]|uniref:Uncharacterized protein n=1 Tax=Melipona bicolor TaxID=60889 RepID=A0AA40FRF5_9HYME|nr:hypothetical protein K0M31_006987 [Melipona bicolor]
MATPRSPIRGKIIPPIEEAHIPQDLEASAINAVITQYFPPFDKENPKLWFHQAEAALRTSRITNDCLR